MDITSLANPPRSATPQVGMRPDSRRMDCATAAVVAYYDMDLDYLQPASVGTSDYPGHRQYQHRSLPRQRPSSSSVAAVPAEAATATSSSSSSSSRHHHRRMTVASSGSVLAGQYTFPRHYNVNSPARVNRSSRHSRSSSSPDSHPKDLYYLHQHQHQQQQQQQQQQQHVGSHNRSHHQHQPRLHSGHHHKHLSHRHSLPVQSAYPGHNHHHRSSRDSVGSNSSGGSTSRGSHLSKDQVAPLQSPNYCHPQHGSHHSNGDEGGFHYGGRSITSHEGRSSEPGSSLTPTDSVPWEHFGGTQSELSFPHEDGASCGSGQRYGVLEDFSDQSLSDSTQTSDQSDHSQRRSRSGKSKGMLQYRRGSQSSASSSEHMVPISSPPKAVVSDSVDPPPHYTYKRHSISGAPPSYQVRQQQERGVAEASNVTAAGSPLRKIRSMQHVPGTSLHSGYPLSEQRVGRSQGPPLSAYQSDDTSDGGGDLDHTLTEELPHPRPEHSKRRYSTAPRSSQHVYEMVEDVTPGRGTRGKNGHASSSPHLRHSRTYGDILPIPGSPLLVQTSRGDKKKNKAGTKDDVSPVSDENGAKKVAGARGKSGNNVMMKLAKKFSKKNLPIARDDNFLEGEWHLNQRSNSVSKLDSLDEMKQRSLSLEQLGPSDLDAGDIAVASSTPQHSPSIPQSLSKNKLGSKKSVDPDSDSVVSGSLYRAGSKKNLSGDPQEALFEAIELGKVEAVASLIDNGLVTKFNTTNDDDLLPLDLSVMLGQHSITRLLLSKGAKDSSKFCRDPIFRMSRIKALIQESDREIYKLKEEIALLGPTNSSGMKEVDRKFTKANFRSHLCRVMLRNYEKSDVPGPPSRVELHVTSNRSLMVTFGEPDNVNNAMITRYKIEWARSADFKPVVGEFVMTDLRTTEYMIPDLDKGETYCVRVSAYNMRGFGKSQVSVPPSATPSCWHDFDHSHPRYMGCTDNIHNLAARFEQSMQDTSTNATQAQSGMGRNRSVRRANPLTRMFSSAIKFHKSLKAGVYIASLFYSDDSRVLVTTDDHLPIVEVADATGTAIGQDFVWMANLACTWENVQAMSDITDSYTTSPAIQFRNMLLHAILDLQNALGVSDLGLLHPVPYKDSQGAIVFVIVQYAKDTKAVASANSSLKWMDLPKLWKRRGTPSRSVGLDAFPVPEQVVLDTHEIIAHHRTATNPMDKGLYLGYLKGRSSVASMKVICPRDHPNVLPYLKIRSNPNLSSCEWQWLKSLQSSSCPLDLHSSCPQSLQQQLLPCLQLFLKNLNFSQEEAWQHQLYVQEVIELNEDITIILVLPPADQVCTAPGSTDHFVDQPDFVALPISTFEIMQLFTYQKSFMSKFSMVRTRVDVELLASGQVLREALSKAEVKEAKEKKEKLEDFHSHTDQLWRQMRWLEEAIQTGRDHHATSDKLLSVATVTRNVEKQRTEFEERKKRQEEALLHNKTAQEAPGKGPSAKSTGGHLRVMLSYRTGLVRGSIVKLFVEQTTTTAEVIKLVVTQVARTSRSKVESDLSDYFMVACLGQKEKVLEPDYAPLQLQMNAAESKDKVLLMVRKHSEEAQMNQMVTNV